MSWRYINKVISILTLIIFIFTNTGYSLPNNTTHLRKPLDFNDKDVNSRYHNRIENLARGKSFFHIDGETGRFTVVVPEGQDFKISPEIYFKKGISTNFVPLLNRLGKNVNKVLLVTDKKLPFLNDVKNHLKNSGVEVVTFDRQETFPSVHLVFDACRVAYEEKVGCVIGLGGGAVMDVASVTATYTHNIMGLDIDDKGKLERLEKFHLSETPHELPGYEENKRLPYIAMPTTAGSGAESTGNAVIATLDKQNKKSFRDQKTDMIIVDPELLYALPVRQTAISGLDAFCSALATLVNSKATDFSHKFSLTAIELMNISLPRAVKDKNNTRARNDLALASLIHGIAIGNSGVGLEHSVAHFIAPYYIEHGVMVSVIMPQKIIVDMRDVTVVKRYNQLADELGFALDESDEIVRADMTAEQMIKIIRDVQDEAGLPKTLEEAIKANLPQAIGYLRERIPQLPEGGELPHEIWALLSRHGSILNNIDSAKLSDSQIIYRVISAMLYSEALEKGRHPVDLELGDPVKIGGQELRFLMYGRMKITEALDFINMLETKELKEFSEEIPEIAELGKVTGSKSFKQLKPTYQMFARWILDRIGRSKFQFEFYDLDQIRYQRALKLDSLQYSIKEIFDLIEGVKEPYGIRNYAWLFLIDELSHGRNVTNILHGLKRLGILTSDELNEKIQNHEFDTMYLLRGEVNDKQIKNSVPCTVYPRLTVDNEKFSLVIFRLSTELSNRIFEFIENYGLKDKRPVLITTPLSVIEPEDISSITDEDRARLVQGTLAYQEAGADCIHYDVREGLYQEKSRERGIEPDRHSNTHLLNPEFISELRKAGLTIPLDVHLLYWEPGPDYIRSYAQLGVRSVLVQNNGFENADHLLETFKVIKDTEMLCGVVLELNEDVSILTDDILETADIVVLTSVVTAGVGRDYASVEDKAKELRQRGYQGEIMIQGGINVENIDESASAGATTFVSGTFVTKAKDMKKAIGTLRQKAEVRLENKEEGFKLQVHQVLDKAVVDAVESSI